MFKNGNKNINKLKINFKVEYDTSLIEKYLPLYYKK